MPGRADPGVGQSVRNPDRGRPPGWLAPLLVFLLCSALVAVLNSHHGEQQTIFRSHYLRMAEHFRGLVHREVLTYPTWGYPFLLWLIPRYSWIVALQVILGALAMTWLYLRLRVELPAHTRVITLAGLAALPWYALHSVKWPLSVFWSLVLLAVLALDWGLRRSRCTAGGIAAGLLLGAALYFRSEGLPLLAFLPVFYALVRRRRTSRGETAAFGLMGLLTVMALLPWAFHYKRQTGRYSLTASQLGIVSFISLGQLPGNPWGIEYADEAAFAYLDKEGIDLAPYSDSADRILRREFRHRVAQHPAAFVKKVLWNGVAALTRGFYNPEPLLDARSDRAFESLRDALRSRSLAGLGQPAPLGARAAFAYWLAAKGLGAGFFLLGMAGLALWLIRADKSSALLALFAAVLMYQFIIQMALNAEPRFLNGVYPFAIPFFAFLVGSLRPRRSVPGSSGATG